MMLARRRASRECTPPPNGIRMCCRVPTPRFRNTATSAGARARTSVTRCSERSARSMVAGQPITTRRTLPDTATSRMMPSATVGATHTAL